MQSAVAKVVAEHLLKGAFDVLDALLAKTFRFDVMGADALDTAGAAGYLADFGVCMSSRVAQDGGSVALLFRVADAVQIAAQVQGEAPVVMSALDDGQRAVLREVAESALGGAVTCLLEAAGRTIERMEETRIEDHVAEDAAALLDHLGRAVTAAPFSFSAEGTSGSGVLLFSDTFEQAVPPKMLAGAAAPKPEPTLSAEEMSDILSGFGEAALQPPGQAAAAPVTPPNIDMVLDIKLVATARLGRIEMAVGDILGLGPGSIVEVGHLIEEPVELLINDRLIARGDVVVVDEKFGLRITEIISPKERIQSLR